MQNFEYISAGSAREVGEVLAANPGRARVFCGGTDLLVQMRENRRKVDQLVDVKNIPEMTKIDYDPRSGLWLGAAACCYALSHHSSVLAHYPGLVDAFHLIGGVQIQFRASVGGNLCNASPAADSIPALIVHGATAVIASTNGIRELPVEHFCTAPGLNAMQNTEFLLAIKVPVMPENFGAHYLRFTPRNEMDIAVAGAGASVILDQTKKKIVSSRIALGAVAPIPLFVEKASEFLAGKEVTKVNIDKAAEIAQAEARPITDLRGTAEYRKHLCAVLTRRALEKAIERARA